MRLLFRLALRVDKTETLHVAEKVFALSRLYVFEVKRVGDTEYIKNPNSNAWMKVGRK